MGRVFEKRKHKIFARNSKLSKIFTRYSREIFMSVKAGGPDPHYNSHLRQIIQNAKNFNTPKEVIDKAIKKASDLDTSNYQEEIYEGYGPHGIAILVKTATDNTTRTVANMRMHFNRGHGTLGTSGSVSFMFTCMGIFQFDLGEKNLDDLELELIDGGAEEITLEDGTVFVYTSFEDFGKMQQHLESLNIEIKNADIQWLPNVQTELTEEQAAEVESLIERLEDDEDVVDVFTNMK